MFAVISSKIVLTKVIALEKLISSFNNFLWGFGTGKGAASSRIFQEKAQLRCTIHEVMNGMKHLVASTEAIEARLDDPAASVFPVITFWTGGHSFGFNSRIWEDGLLALCPGEVNHIAIFHVYSWHV